MAFQIGAHLSCRFVVLDDKGNFFFLIKGIKVEDRTQVAGQLTLLQGNYCSRSSAITRVLIGRRERPENQQKSDVGSEKFSRTFAGVEKGRSP